MNPTPLRSLHNTVNTVNTRSKHIFTSIHSHRSHHPLTLPLRHFNSVIHSTPNVSQKDCLRLAFIYGACGTFASYLSMNYDGKVLVFKWSVPSPERFIFHTWCWSVAGMTSWMLFWTKPDALIRVAGSRIKFGVIHGMQVWCTISECTFYHKLPHEISGDFIPSLHLFIECVSVFVLSYCHVIRQQD